MTKKLYATLYAFGLMLNKRQLYSRLDQPIFLIHKKPLEPNFFLEEYVPTSLSSMQKARFEHKGKWDKNKEFPIFEFIGLE